MMLGGFVLFCLVVTDFGWFWLVACFITNGGSSEKAASFQVCAKDVEFLTTILAILNILHSYTPWKHKKTL